MRRLTLKKDVLTELGTAELVLVVGAASTPAETCVGTIVSKALQCETRISPCATHTCP
jgi:hypothetical protein